MWYPNRAQWWAIWVGFVTAAFVWYDGASYDGSTERLAVIVLVGTGLLVWKLSRHRNSFPRGAEGSSYGSHPTVRAAMRRGAPMPPWDITAADRATAHDIATLFNSAGTPVVVVETPGEFGAALEVRFAGASGSADPILIMSRRWDLDSRALTSMLTPGGFVDGPLEATLLRAGFQRIGPHDHPFSPFVRP